MPNLSRRTVSIVFIALGFSRAGISQHLDKPQAAVSLRESTLLAAVTAASQSMPKDPQVAKAYRELADFYSSQSRYPEAEKLYQKRLELEEDSLGRANPQLCLP